MALAQIKKIELIAISKHKSSILDTLQNFGTVEVNNLSEEESEFKKIEQLQKTELTYANLAFAIQVLSPYAEKKSLFAQAETLSTEEVKKRVEEFDFESVITNCSESEEMLTKAKNKINSLDTELEALDPWKNLEIVIPNICETATINVMVGSMPTPEYANFKEELKTLSVLTESKTVSADEKTTHFYVIFDKKLKEEVRGLLAENKFAQAELPKTEKSVKEYIQELKEEKKEQEKITEKSKKELTTLAKTIEELKIAHDWFGWELEKLETERKFNNTESSFVITGWIPSANIQKLEEELSKITNQWTLREIEPEEDEKPPVVIKNSNFLSPFEAVTNVYGLPKASELDPTPFLAAFFILFFALALTDAGYGIVMFITMALMLKFFKLAPGIKKLVRLLMYGGIATFIIGVLFGGWFGLTPDQVPSFLSYTSASGEEMFIFQKINAVNSPLTVLILALALGYVQILLGVLIKMVHTFKYESKKDAILDSGTWLFMLTGWGLLILGAAFEMPVLAEISKWWLITATILIILTQGREKKNIVMKFVSGVLGLYGLVGYMSDILSYSRLLALGLATAIIGLAVNIVADLAGSIPYIGWIFMIVIFIGGHIFNLLINSLGSFIHAGRLQFVEFFTKFMEGGGRNLKPFSKKTKYIFLNNNF